MMSNSFPPIEIFYSYAHEDESLRTALEKHLSALSQQGLIAGWYNRQILPGTNWAQAIDEHLERASIILLLVSADFLASDYCYGIEMRRALERHQAKQACVIPILIRPVDWQGAPFAHLQSLPINAQAVTSWSNQDAAFADVAKGIRRAIENQVSHLSNILPAGSRQDKSPQHQTSPFPQSVSERKKSSRKTMPGFWHDPIWQAIGVLVAVIGIIVPIIASHLSFRSLPSASSPGNAFPSYPPSHGPLIMSDPLVNNNRGYHWYGVNFPDDPGSCQFATDGYHIQAGNDYYPCQEMKAVSLNLWFEVEMKLRPGSAGGLSFRNNAEGGGYDVDVSPTGYYSIDRPNNTFLAPRTFSRLIPKGQPSYLVAIEMLGNQITLYVDKMKITSATDTTPSCDALSTCGYIGLYVTGDNGPPQTEATFTNLEIWSLV